MSPLLSMPSTLWTAGRRWESLPVPLSTCSPSSAGFAVPSTQRRAALMPWLGEEDDMRAAIFNGPKDIIVGDRPDPTIQEPTDAVVRVVLACVCGSDLWYYRGESDHA